MKKPPLTDEKKLKREWVKKLKQSGFEDIEADEFNLRTWSNQFSRDVSLNSWRAKEEYYRLATHFLNDYKFESNREQVIWEYHTNGISVRDITKLLKKVRIKTNRTTVWQVVNRLEKIMKKMYGVTDE